MSVNLALIVDTHVILWLAIGHKNLSKNFLAALQNPENKLFISAITAWEYSDLRVRGRLGNAPSMANIISDYGYHLLDYHADLWEFAEALPDVHRDPIDRMLVAQAIALDLSLVTADKTLNKYPVKILW